ncbi:MAG: YicC/YloC family endoribonuclease [Janthinobacterium lividum]
MIFSMTGYASATRDLRPNAQVAEGPSVTISVDLRSVNSRFLDLNFRMPEELRAAEPALREMLMTRLARGKVDIRVNVQHGETVISTHALNRDELVRLAELEQAVLKAFPQAGRLSTGEVLRWPGVMANGSIDPNALRDAIVECGAEALEELVKTRGREGAQLVDMLLRRVTDMEAIVARMEPLVPELIATQQRKIVDRLQELLGVAVPVNAPSAISREEVAERIRQEVTMYGIRIDVAEELSRLTAHLKETRRVLAAGGRAGKRLDFMMQELNREANTLGSKAAAKELADASMALKLLIEQMREQVQNLE